MESILDISKKIVDLIKDTPEYKNYLKSKQELEQNDELKNLYLRYRESLSKMYINNKFGDGKEAEINDQLYMMYESLNNNPISKQYMVCEEVILNFYKEINNLFTDEIELLK